MRVCSRWACRCWGSVMGCNSLCIILGGRWWVAETPLFGGLPGNLHVWMSHGDHAEALPAGFELTAKTANAVAGIADEARRIWAVQFHPEVAHTLQGMELLRNFCLDICGAEQDWTPEHFIQSTVERVKAQVGDGHGICGLSGGGD